MVHERWRVSVTLNSFPKNYHDPLFAKFTEYLIAGAVIKCTPSPSNVSGTIELLSSTESSEIIKLAAKQRRTKFNGNSKDLKLQMLKKITAASDLPFIKWHNNSCRFDTCLALLYFLNDSDQILKSMDGRKALSKMLNTVFALINKLEFYKVQAEFIKYCESNNIINSDENISSFGSITCLIPRLVNTSINLYYLRFLRSVSAPIISVQKLIQSQNKHT